MSQLSPLLSPLLEKSTLAFEAFPFDRLDKSQFEPALNAAMAQAKDNLKKIRDNPSPPDFANTILALETSSEYVHRVAAIFFSLQSAVGDDEMHALGKKLAPTLAGFASDVLLDGEIFKRVNAVWENRAALGLCGEDLKLSEKTYRDFRRNGGLLGTEEKLKLREIDQELARLGSEYSENVLKAVNAFSLVLENAADLAGLPESAVGAAKAAADARGLSGKWLITLQMPSYIPFMTYSSRSDLREKLYRAMSSKAFRDDFDNSENALKIASLRHQRATLLGYKTHAHFVLEERMAETPEQVNQFLDRLFEKAMPAARREVAELKDFKKQQSGDENLMPWDSAYWSEKLKLERHNFDEEALRPYFQLENVIAGVFEHARRLYGLEFTENRALPVYHPEVKTYEVRDASDGRFIGLLYGDFFPRETKQGGAWQTTFRDQGLQLGALARPHASIVCNFTKPLPNKPSLLTLDEVRTLFHEFGHALHSLLSDCKYVSLAGTNVSWDFVELPSQIMENWVTEKEGLDIFAAHFESGEKIPLAVTEKIRASAKFQAGMFAIRQLTFAALDMAWHATDPAQITDVAEFEKRITDRFLLLPRVDGVNQSCSFTHIFSGGYSAGYYSYKWAEVLDADAFEYFKEQGLFNRAVAKSFRDNILSRGGTEPPMELYKKFRGRVPDPDALLRRDGLIP